MKSELKNVQTFEQFVANQKAEKINEYRAAVETDLKEIADAIESGSIQGYSPVYFEIVASNIAKVKKAEDFEKIAADVRGGKKSGKLVVGGGITVDWKLDVDED